MADTAHARRAGTGASAWRPLPTPWRVRVCVSTCVAPCSVVGSAGALRGAERGHQAGRQRQRLRLTDKLVFIVAVVAHRRRRLPTCRRFDEISESMSLIDIECGQLVLRRTDLSIILVRNAEACRQTEKKTEKGATALHLHKIKTI